MGARERIRKDKANGEDLATRLKQVKHLTAGFCWNQRGDESTWEDNIRGL